MRTIVSVQALRAIAALAVALGHFDIVRLMLIGRASESTPIYPLVSGVDLFFVISGFVMVYSSEDLFGAKGGSFSFLTRRIARIVPPYWLMTVIAIPVMSLPYDWKSIFDSFFFIPFSGENGSINPLYGVGWTLNFEMYFYALFSVAILLPRRFAVPILGALLGGIVLLGNWLRPESAVLLYWSDPIILEFVFGMILAMLYIHGVRLPASLRVFLVISGIGAIWVFAPHMPPSEYRVLQWGIPAAMVFGGVVIGQEINFGWLRAPARILGDSSYALYLTHPLMTAAVFLGWNHGLNRYPEMLVLFLALVAVQMISIAIFYLFEKRSNRFLQRILVPHPRVAEARHGA
jgi:exopolysaccharide production protein ExoZ